MTFERQEWDTTPVGPDMTEPGRDATLAVSWLGHSTVVIDLGGVRLITDPLLRHHNGLLRRDGPRPVAARWESADAVLLSHLHHDHAEIRSLRMLGDAPVLTGRDNARWLRRRGLHGVGLDGWTFLGGTRVRLVKAVHHSRRMPHRPNDAHGHLLRSDTLALWVAGDTSLYDEMTDLPARAGTERLDLAVVPIGGWGPRLSSGHMGPREAAEACRRTRARLALPVHWGTLHAPLTRRLGDWFDRPLDAFEAEVSTIAPFCRVLRLAPGQVWSAPERSSECYDDA